MSTIICPAKECSKRFKLYKALSCHQHRCKFMPGVVSVVTKCYVEFDGIARAQKRHRTSFSSTAGDEDQQNDAEAIDFEKNLKNLLPIPLETISSPSAILQSRLVVVQDELPHLPSYKSQKQRREEAAAEEAMRQASLPTPTPPPHPITPVELQTIQTEEDEFG
ncbi:hypothetical protein BDM02DRAFT_3193443 [Thelephora ganbajun]|uniref:Uncharacterized protein n=1 Tax=Thelephora ganbajun TaxID=370292 RepID=A0ACB6YYR1_THEGA|nr:hypothetical protein BDM02DRAFT_3193443 [Thelephora ganbajun]